MFFADKRRAEMAVRQEGYEHRGIHGSPTTPIGTSVEKTTVSSDSSASSPTPPTGTRPPRPTMLDVARAAGVSLKTVSRVVNGEPGVTAETAQRVADVIGRLGFRRNDSARLLRQGVSTGSIAFILEDVADPFYATLARAVLDVARSHEYLVLAGCSDENPVFEKELAQAFCARRVDGLVIVPAPGGDHRYLVAEMRMGTAVVFADRPATGIDADTILVDNSGGVRAAVQHLLGQGHRRLAYLGDDLRVFTSQERLAGYREALAQAGLPVDERLVFTARPEPEFVRQALTEALAGPEPATALLTGNSRVTILALHQLRARNEQPALVGFDDFESAELLDVTVVAQDPAAIGRAAATLLFDRLAGDSRPIQTVRLPTRLVVRGSSTRRP